MVESERAIKEDAEKGVRKLIPYKQSRRESLIEAGVNTLVGLVFTLVAVPFVNWVCEVEMSGGQIAGTTSLMTIWSVFRGYIVRRFFNNLDVVKTYLNNKFKTI